jgi:hypothetical protein
MLETDLRLQYAILRSSEPRLPRDLRPPRIAGSSSSRPATDVAMVLIAGLSESTRERKIWKARFSKSSPAGALPVASFVKKSGDASRYSMMLQAIFVVLGSFASKSVLFVPSEASAMI